MKVALFVEGQTEQIFVSDLLLKWYNYDETIIGFECVAARGATLFRGGFTTYGSPASENFFLIRNIGNDESVISRMQEEAENMIERGYRLIIGLRDMYSQDYSNKIRTYPKQIDQPLNQRYIDGARNILANHPQSRLLRIHHAIMEVEAWLLGMPSSLLGLSPAMTKEYIRSQGYTFVDDLDPETTIFHPTAEIAKLGRSLNIQPYHKHDYEIINMCKCLKRSDYESLMRSGKCQSFNLFAQELLGIAE